ncbi:PREDICTED: lysosomal acid phosphatase-like [Rhagoletis zephyria]|uniref:lysosomal acid phosphatase-like n=1 Tax=Rhagoletis zephyria TaxID=28612 RepID=UPI0008117BF3|nr:PREDICTED: lysosomal acid phosphatase-like [Rhagoletis zephyria]
MRYYRLLPPNGVYTQQQVHALSSAAERCVMSAQSVLAGFMPPLDHNNVLPIAWQPAAVNIIPRSEDTLLAQKKPCLKYDTILQKLYKNPSPDVRQLNEENADLFKLLTKHSGKVGIISSIYIHIYIRTYIHIYILNMYELCRYNPVEISCLHTWKSVNDSSDLQANVRCCSFKYNTKIEGSFTQ